VAANCWVLPAAMLAVAGVTVMVVSVGVTMGTVIAAVALMPWIAAVMVDDPAAAAVTRPEVPTVTTVVLEEVQVRPEVTAAVDPSL
jgi:hypothetical protein